MRRLRELIKHCQKTCSLAQRVNAILKNIDEKYNILCNEDSEYKKKVLRTITRSLERRNWLKKPNKKGQYEQWKQEPCLYIGVEKVPRHQQQEEATVTTTATSTPTASGSIAADPSPTATPTAPPPLKRGRPSKRLRKVFCQ